MLTVSHLNKSFPGLDVLEDFSLTVPRNGFTALVGPSGCGKSTFFDVLTGVENKDRGEILWLGQSMANLGKNAAYMQQKDLLLPWLSLLDNALLPTRINGEDLRKSREKALAYFQRLGLGGFESYIPQKVSGGMRQRCALVRTLMFEKELVLLDEPLSALDAITRRSLQSMLLLLQSEFKKTILMITHDVEEALLLADEVLVLTQLPMRIQERFVPSMSKPRKGSDPELIQIKEHIMEELQGELKDEPL